MDQRVGEIVDLFPRYLDRLRRILDTDLTRYTDLPIQDRLYVEDIDSFAKVRDVNPSIVAPFLSNGFLDLSENRVQLALEQILDVSFHRIDWPGEMNDLYTANTLVNGARRATAFLLKGPGIGRKEMQIGDCGKNGDQLVRLFNTPADLYIVQYVGPISDLLIKDVEGGGVPSSVEKEKWRILPVGEVHDQPAALAGGHRRNTPWTNVSGSRRRRTSWSESRWVS
jgi:hypothetical protein